jgi:hypothetical protein
MAFAFDRDFLPVSVRVRLFRFTYARGYLARAIKLNFRQSAVSAFHVTVFTGRAPQGLRSSWDSSVESCSSPFEKFHVRRLDRDHLRERA